MGRGTQSAFFVLSVMPEEHAVHVSNRPPLYFQHQGHSRTIVGIERSQLRTSPPRVGRPAPHSPADF